MMNIATKRIATNIADGLIYMLIDMQRSEGIATINKFGSRYNNVTDIINGLY